MKQMRVLTVLLLVLAAFCLTASQVFACTIVGVGKEATVDGSTIVTHNDDSSGADYRTWIIPGGEWEEGAMRNIAVNSHAYGDFSNFPEVEDYGKGYIAGQTPQAAKTYAYFHSRYSYMNEVGVAMGEATNSLSARNYPELRALLFGTNTGIIDCWNAQDIALERATTAREAVQIMGALVEEFGWGDSSETINITDGTEVWIFESYGLDLWCAARIPDDHFFIAANSARINYVEFDNPDWYMCSPNIIQFAIDNGLYDPNSGKDFNPAATYCPYGANLRVWRGFDIVAPSLKLDPTTPANEYPLSVKPDYKLTVQDVFEIKGDYYQGTPYDKSLYPEAGPWGDPNIHTKQRSIGVPQSCYVIVCQVKEWLPASIRGIVWHGFGGANTTFLTPLWASMTRMPDIYTHENTRYMAFSRESAWWISSYVQQIASTMYNKIEPEIHAKRQPRMDSVYKQAENIQVVAARMIRQGLEAEAIDMITTFAYNTAVEWYDMWLEFGDYLMGKYMWGRVTMSNPAKPQWWNDIMASAPMRPADQ